MRIRVLRVIARMNVGGPALQVTGLLRGLDSHRFDHRLLVGDVGDDEEDFLALRAPDLQVERLPGMGRDPRIGGDARSLTRLRQEIRRFQPHVVHTHTAKAGVVGRVAALTSGASPALVHTFHGHLLHGYFPRPATSAIRYVEAALARRTDRLFSVGTRVRDELLAAGIGRPEQYVVMPPGVSLPPPPSRSDARRALDLPRGAPVVTYVGRLTGVKQPLRFLAVARLLAERHPDLRVLVAGGGPMERDVAAAAAALGGRVHLLGWWPNVETVYAASDLVLLTSDNEGMPITLIEAAMVGIPAVATDVGSVREVVIDGVTGRITPLDVDALFEAADELLRQPQVRSRMAEAATEHATRHFTVERLVADTAAIYETLVAGDAH